MASIQIQNDAESVVDVGEKPVTKRVVLVMGEETEQALIDLVNERRQALRSRVSEGTPVVGPVENVEEALLDVIGGIGAYGGSSWFRHNFGSLHVEGSKNG